MSKPVDTDPQADATELLRRAADDYATAHPERDDPDREDRLHGNEVGR